MYLLIIGKASVVSSAPLALHSPLPPSLVSAMAWIIKKMVLNNRETDKNEALLCKPSAQLPKAHALLLQTDLDNHLT